MRHCRFLILIALGFLSGTGTRAQKSLHYLFRHIDQADGLLHNDILAVTQDRKGFIWIATPNGLQRYDGSRFIHYPEMLNNAAAGLTYNVEMYADKKKDQVWIINNSSVEKLELDKKHFSLYSAETLLKDPSFELATYRGAANDKWLLGHHALYHYDTITNRYIIFGLNFLPDNASQAATIATDSTGNMTWVVTTTSLLYLFDNTNKTASSNSFNPRGHPLLQPASFKPGNHSFRFVMTDSRHNTWVTTWGNTLYRYNDSTKKVSAYSLSSIKKTEGRKATTPVPLINCMLEDDNHTLWLGTEHAGLLRYNREQDNFDYCISREENSESLRYNYKIFSLFQDRERNIWVGTDKGANIFNPYRQYFRALRPETNSASISKNEIISFIQLSTGDIFIGTWGGGIAVYDQQLNFKKMLHFKGPSEMNFVWSFLQPDDKTLWIGCQHGWLLIYNLVTGATQTLHPPEMEGSTIRCMVKDNTGNIMLGLHNGKIVQWHRQQNGFTTGAGPADSLKKFPGQVGYQKLRQVATLPDVGVVNILIDSSGQCWVSTLAGFKAFDPGKGVYTHTWLPDQKNPNSISGKTCQGLEEYNDSTLLIGTAYGGLNFFNKKTKAFSHVGTTGGLPSNTVYAIKKGEAGNVWLTTDYGLYKFNPSEGKIVPYSIDPGIINANFTASRFYPLHDGQWLTYTSSEAICFFPGKAGYQGNQPPAIEITGFKIFDRPVSMDSLLFENKPIRLSWKENFFTVEFAALSFLELHLANYQYRLRGIDKDWVNGGTKRFANYTDLRPGEYTFDVKAESDGSSGATTSIKIIITPPFWKTWWFIAVVSCCILFLIFFFIKGRERNIKANAWHHEQLSKAKLEALRSQMNPHFIFNCINSIDALIQSNDKYHATVYLNKFAKLIRNILDSSKQNTVTLSKDLDTLKLYIELEQLRHENKFTAEITADNALLQDDYKVPPLIIQPFVENAILHGIRYRTDNNGKLSVSVIKQGDCLQYTIEDNGVGRNKGNGQAQKKGKVSYGIDMSNERVRLFNHEEKASVRITDLTDNDQPVGTKVEVFLKIQ